MTKDRVAIGTRVTLNSGSPPLLIVDIDGDYIECAYKDDDGTVYEEWLHMVCVKEITDG